MTSVGGADTGLFPDEWAEPARPSPPVWVVVAVGGGGALYALALAYGLVYGSGMVLGALAVVPPMAILTGVLARVLARADRDPAVVALVMGGFAVKMLGGLARYWVTYNVYGNSDATGYDKWARYLAAQFRQGDFDVDVGGEVIGTKFFRLVAGVIYTFIPASRIAAFLVFSWLGFLGLLLCWRAFKLAVPRGAHRRYALLVLLLPSLVYWPSAVGKEAWMVLVLGCCALGTARLLTDRIVTGTLFLAAGLAGSAMVRPHLTLVVFNGLLFAFVLRRNTSGNPLVPLLAVGLLLGVGLFLVQQNKEFFGVETLTRESVEHQLADTEERTSEAGSAFTPIRVSSPAHFPLALFTVLYRPLPIEAGSIQGALTALEGVVLLVITALSWRRLADIPRAFRGVPYVSYCVGFIVTFVIAFSAFSNFGILARQRTQMLPLFLALLALPEHRRPRVTA